MTAWCRSELVFSAAATCIVGQQCRIRQVLTTPSVIAIAASSRTLPSNITLMGARQPFILPPLPARAAAPLPATLPQRSALRAAPSTPLPLPPAAPFDPAGQPRRQAQTPYRRAEELHGRRAGGQAWHAGMAWHGMTL